MDTTQQTDLDTPPPRSLAPELPSRTSLREWLSVVAVALGAFTFVTTEFLPAGILPDVARSLGVSTGSAGLMVTVPGIVAAFAPLLVLLTVRRLDRRRLLLVLATCLLASNLVASVAGSFATLLAARALFGAALGAFWTLALSTAGRLVQPADATRAAALIFTGVSLATILGVPLGAFISSLAGWHWAFGASALFSAVSLGMMLVFLPALPAHQSLRVADLGTFLGRNGCRAALAVIALVFGGHFAAYSYMAPLLLGSHASLDALTALLFGYGIIGLVANIAVTPAVTRHLQLSVKAAVLALGLTLALLVISYGSLIAAGLLTLAWGAVFGVIPLAMSTWTIRLSPESPEAGSALLITVIQVAIAAGSFAGGVAVNASGPGAAPAVGAAFLIAAAAVLFAPPRRA